MVWSESAPSRIQTSSTPQLTNWACTVWEWWNLVIGDLLPPSSVWNVFQLFFTFSIFDWNLLLMMCMCKSPSHKSMWCSVFYFNSFFFCQKYANSRQIKYSDITERGHRFSGHLRDYICFGLKKISISRVCPAPVPQICQFIINTGQSPEMTTYGIAKRIRHKHLPRLCQPTHWERAGP